MVPPSYLARRLRRAYGWPGGEKNKQRGGGCSPTSLLVVYYNVQFYKLFLIYVYKDLTFTVLHSVHLQYYILYNNQGFSWMPKFDQRFFFAQILILYRRFLADLGRAAAGPLFHGIKGKYLVDNLVLVSLVRKQVTKSTIIPVATITTAVALTAG